MFSILIIGLCWWLWVSYNKLVVLKENCDANFSNISTEIKRRFDLYMKVASVLQNGSEFERNIFIDVAKVRTREDLSVSEKIQAVNKLLAVAENNPDIKSINLYTNMQTAIDQTENRIQNARQVYNEIVNEYNATIAKLPMRFAAIILRFKPRKYFEYTETEE